MMDKIKLRAVEPEDVDFIFECENDPSISIWSDDRAPLSRSQLLTYALTYDADPFAAGQLRLIIVGEDGERIGIIDLYEISEKDSRAFIGLCIHPSRRGKGLAKEALEALRNLATNKLGIRQFAAKVSTENHIASHLFETAGYEKLTVLPRWHKIGSKFHDFYLFLLNIR